MGFDRTHFKRLAQGRRELAAQPHIYTTAAHQLGDVGQIELLTYFSLIEWASQLFAKLATDISCCGDW